MLQCRTNFLFAIRLPKTSSRRLARRLKVVLKTSSRRLPRRLQDVFARRLEIMSSRRLGRQKNFTLKTSSRRLQDVFSTFSPRRMFAGYGALILTLEFQSNSTRT